MNSVRTRSDDLVHQFKNNNMYNVILMMDLFICGKKGKLVPNILQHFFCWGWGVKIIYHCYVLFYSLKNSTGSWHIDI